MHNIQLLLAETMHPLNYPRRRRAARRYVIAVYDAALCLSVFTARCYASAVLAMALCPSVCLSVCPSVRHKSVFY